jgi:hypothetical protein
MPLGSAWRFCFGRIARGGAEEGIEIFLGVGYAREIKDPDRYLETRPVTPSPECEP